MTRVKKLSALRIRRTCARMLRSRLTVQGTTGPSTYYAVYTWHQRGFYSRNLGLNGLSTLFGHLDALGV